MSKSIPDELAALTLGEGALIRGIHVVRRSLLGFQIGPGPDLVDAAAAAARIAVSASGPRKRGPSPHVAICFRCAGDGLGRRDRGACGVCHGRGIQIVEPAAGWAAASPDAITSAINQATQALREARHPRARESLGELLALLTPSSASATAA
jgi:hypothetical protein